MLKKSRKQRTTASSLKTSTSEARAILVQKIKTAWDGCLTAWGAVVPRLVEVGRLLLDAKAEMKELKQQTQFLAWVESNLPFKRKTAQRLMAIAKNSVLAAASHGTLPPDTHILAMLSKVPEPKLKGWIEAKKVTAGSSQKEVMALVQPRKKAEKSEASSEDKDFKDNETLMRLISPRLGAAYFDKVMQRAAREGKSPISFTAHALTVYIDTIEKQEKKKQEPVDVKVVSAATVPVMPDARPNG